MAFHVPPGPGTSPKKLLLSLLPHAEASLLPGHDGGGPGSSPSIGKNLGIAASLGTYAHESVTGSEIDAEYGVFAHSHTPRLWEVQRRSPPERVVTMPCALFSGPCGSRKTGQQKMGRMPLRKRNLFSSGPLFHEHRHGTPQPAGGVPGKKDFSQGSRTPGSILRLLGRWTGPGKGGSSLPGRKGKNVKLSETEFLHGFQGPFEGGGILSGKAHEKIRADVEILSENTPGLRKDMGKIPNAVPSPHFLEYLIVSALKGNVEMRAELRSLSKHCKKIGGYGKGLQRTKTDAPHSGDAPDLLHQPSQRFSSATASVAAEMNSRENDLPAPSPDKAGDLFHNILLPAAYGFPPKMGDNAVGAEVAASILDFHESPGVPEKTGKKEGIPGVPGPRRPRKLLILLQRLSSKQSFRKKGNAVFDAVSHHQIRFGERLFPTEKVLGIATAENAAAFGRPPGKTAKDGTPFSFRQGGDGAGEKNSQVPGRLGNHLPSSFEKHGPQGLRLVLVGTASQGLDGHPGRPRNDFIHRQSFLPRQG